MSSERRIRASRANGALSRGPVTPEGKARSALNALGHGLSAKQVVLTSESEDAFNRLRDACHAEFASKSSLETDLVEQLVAARWRIQRSWGLETGLLDLEMLKQADQVAQDFEVIEDHIRTAVAFRALTDESRSLALLNRYEARHRRTYERTLQLLFRRPAPPDQPDPPDEPDPGPHAASNEPVLPATLLIAAPSAPVGGDVTSANPGPAACASLSASAALTGGKGHHSPAPSPAPPSPLSGASATSRHRKAQPAPLSCRPPFRRSNPNPRRTSLKPPNPNPAPRPALQRAVVSFSPPSRKSSRLPASPPSSPPIVTPAAHSSSPNRPT